jgi:biotin carboxyl carrier protein
MRYDATVGGQKEATSIEIEPSGPGYKVTVNGESYQVNAVMLDPGGISLLVDGKSYAATIQEKKDRLSVLVRNRIFDVSIIDERRGKLNRIATRFSSQGKQIIASPMPGKVVRVLVNLGDSVLEGQGLVVVEAMKMENELKSPKAGKVIELNAREGSAVDNNAILVVVE